MNRPVGVPQLEEAHDARCIGDYAQRAVAVAARLDVEVHAVPRQDPFQAVQRERRELGRFGFRTRVARRHQRGGERRDPDRSDLWGE